MTPIRRRTLTWLLATLPLVSGLATARAQEPIPVRRLGGTNTFHKPPLQSAAEVRAMAVAKRADIEAVLAEAQWNGKADDLFRALAETEPTETTIAVGQTLPWMALRKKGVPGVVRLPRWEGKVGFEAYRYTFLSNDWQHTFVIPKACGNLALLEQVEAPPPVAVLEVRPDRDCVSRKLTIDATRSSVKLGTIAKVTAEVKSPDGKRESLGAPDNAGVWSWTRSYTGPGPYEFQVVATDDRGRTSAPATDTAEITPCPPTAALTVGPSGRLTGETFTIDTSASKAEVGEIKMVKVTIVGPTGTTAAELELAAPFRTDTRLDKPGVYTIRAVAIDSLGQESSPIEQTFEILPRLGFASHWFAGHETRRRDEPGCLVRTAKLAGVRGAVTWLTSRGFELATGIGFVVNLRDSDNSGFFADVEGNALFEGGFVGAGVGVWDINQSEFRDADLLVHGGIDLGFESARQPVSLYLEGRVPVSDLDDIENNFMVFLGLRLHH